MTPRIHADRLPNAPPPRHVRYTRMRPPAWAALQRAASSVASYDAPSTSLANAAQSAEGALAYDTSSAEAKTCSGENRADGGERGALMVARVRAPPPYLAHAMLFWRSDLRVPVDPDSERG